MKKSALLTFFSISCILLLSMYYIKMHYQNISALNTLVDGFNCSGAKFISGEIYAWGKIDNSDNNLKDFEVFAKKFLHDLQIVGSENTAPSIVTNDYMRKLEWNFDIDENKVASINMQLDKKPGIENKKTITVSFTHDKIDSYLDETVKTVLKAFEKNDIEPKLNLCLIGNYDGKLGYEQLNDICKNILKGTKARKIDNMRDGNLISVSAYSPSIGDSIDVNGRAINLNLAIRYNSFEDKTYIWLATPVIAVEY